MPYYTCAFPPGSDSDGERLSTGIMGPPITVLYGCEHEHVSEAVLCTPHYQQILSGQAEVDCIQYGTGPEPHDCRLRIFEAGES